MKEWLEAHPEIRTIRAAMVDLNGQARGKRLPVRAIDKVLDGGLKMPISALNVDIWGDDIEDSPLVFETGDRDGEGRPTERGFLPVPWLEAPSALLPLWMYGEDGKPYMGDPRHALDAVLSRFREKGWTPICATELEFYLIDDSGAELQPPPSPRSPPRPWPPVGSRNSSTCVSLPALSSSR